MDTREKGFTLIELVVVMAIIAVLAALMVAALSAARKQAVNTQRVANVKTIEIALENRLSACDDYFGWSTTHTNQNVVGGKCYYTGTTRFTTSMASLSNNLKGEGWLSNNITVDSENGYAWTNGNPATASSAVSYTLTACDTATTAHDKNQDYANMIQGSPDATGTEGPCLGGHVLYSTSR